jgi:protoporphyrinogen oxidase
MTESHRTVSAVILGGGPAGLYLAYRLITLGRIKGRVVVLERQPYCGGLARSFETQGLWFDLGSHRLHPSIHPQILADIKFQLGDDLLLRPRNGRIFIANRMIRFPLHMGDLLGRLPIRIIRGIIRDLVTKPLTRPPLDGTFESELLASIGPTLCHNFYFPYARKLWGLEPSEIHAVQAHKRVAANSISKILRKITDSVISRQRPGQVFFYPRFGFGQIVHALERHAVDNGVEVLTGHVVTVMRPIRLDWEVECLTAAGARLCLRTATVFSTIPAPALIRLQEDRAPPKVRTAAAELRYRGMILVYLILAQKRFTQFDAHYFPGEDVIFSRVSEPRNYSDCNQPTNLTGLCAEIPCSPGDATWSMPETTLIDRVVRDLSTVGLKLPQTMREGFVKREANVYPLYDREFSERMAKVEDFVATLNGIVAIGRQALFVHDNTHHTMEMALRAADCLITEGHFDFVKWRGYREAFEKNVVED